MRVACNSASRALPKFRGAGKKPGSQGWDYLERGRTVLARSLPTPVPGVSGRLSTICLLLMVQLIIVLPFLLRIMQSRAIPVRMKDHVMVAMTQKCVFLLSGYKTELCCPPNMHVIKQKEKKNLEKEYLNSECLGDPRIHLH